MKSLGLDPNYYWNNLMDEVINFKLRNESGKMRIDLYTRPECSQCEKAKLLLNENNYGYTEHNIDSNKHWLLQKYPSLKVLPVVFLDGIPIGGLEELKQYIVKESLEG